MIKNVRNELKINYHIFENCNMKCLFCFRAKDKNMNTNIDYKKVIEKVLKCNLIKHINIAGGEPTLYKNILELLDFCSKNFKTVSIISNGSLIWNNRDKLETIIKVVDTFGLSIDSLDHEVNLKSGRHFLGKTLSFEEVCEISKLCKMYKTKFKLNIVVNRENLVDETIYKIKTLNVDRIKLLKNQDMNLSISAVEFDNYVSNFKKNVDRESIVIEKEMTNSYLMIDSEMNVSVDRTKNYDLNVNQDILEKLANRIISSDLYLKRYN